MSDKTAGKHEQRGQQLGRLVDEKNAAYGNSFAKTGAVLRLLYPDGIAPEQYDDALYITRVLDKLFRVATRKQAFGESPVEDIGGYSLLKVVIDEEKTTNEEMAREYAQAGTRAAIWPL